MVKSGRVVGEGWHRRAGEPHAERIALDKAGDEAAGADLYVTLEPCRHTGRTAPCTEAVIAAGIRRVIACHRDPDQRVAGAGFDELRRAGLGIEVGVLEAEALALNLGYLVPKLLGRPAVTLKWASSLDGRIATRSGDSQWISSPAARRWAVAERDAHDAVLVGVGTVLADDPRLDRRSGRRPDPVLKVVLDRDLRTPAEARMFGSPSGKARVILYCEAGNERQVGLERAGAEVRRLPVVTPSAVLEDLSGRGVGSVLVEGGSEIHGAFLLAGAYDRVSAVVAPRIIGGREAPGAVGGAGFDSLAEAAELEAVRVRRRGGDVLLSGLRKGCLRELSERLAG